MKILSRKKFKKSYLETLFKKWYYIGNRERVSAFLGIKKGKIESKKEVIAAQVGAAKSLDPQGTNDKRSLEVIVQVYDTLVEVDKNMELKDGIKFHNEEPLKVEDVIFSLNRVKNSKIVGAIGESIESVEKVDDKTSDINTKYPTKTLLKFLADSGALIVSEKDVNEYGNSFG